VGAAHHPRTSLPRSVVRCAHALPQFSYSDPPDGYPPPIDGAVHISGRTFSRSRVAITTLQQICYASRRFPESRPPREIPCLKRSGEIADNQAGHRLLFAPRPGRNYTMPSTRRANRNSALIWGAREGFSFVVWNGLKSETRGVIVQLTAGPTNLCCEPNKPRTL